MGDLNIVVCVKQVPETTDVEIDAETGRLKRDGVVSALNPFDEFAVEAALRLKERYGGVVKVVTMGPPMAESALRDALSLGCDQAWLATDKAFAGADTWATSCALGLCIEKLAPYDIVICGLKTTDGDTGQTGPELAERLGIPHICYVNEILGISDGEARVTRMLDDGVETLKASLPVLITVTKEINQPRLATLRGKLAAKKATVAQLTLNDVGGNADLLGLNGSPTRVIKVFAPPKVAGGEVLEGSAEELADRIFTKLLECKVI